MRKGSASFRVQARQFWDWYEAPQWEPCTVSIFEERLGSGVRYLDLGAYIGPTAIYAAALGCDVVALEPDPEVCRELESNVALNPELAPRIRIQQLALGLADGETMLHVGEASRASLLATSAETRPVRVRSVSPETLARDIGEVDFVKIDVEGAEYLFLPRLVAALRGRPAIYLSTHPGMLVDRGKLRSAPRAFALNWRLLWALHPYRRHLVYEDSGRIRDIRRRNLLRLAFPFAGRAAFLVDNCLFTR